ncbi:MAG: 5'/3'-nucleotidase SurE [Candidatus Cloacimonetes bacterium]|nr:5'/3'-nucleotidase SurE [Candidatus Cloacimonadota bacterium]
MKILLTNDDGFDADGIKTLEQSLLEEGHEIVIVAPDSEKSAASHSLTLHQPIRIIQRGVNRYSVTGTPADCIIMAFSVILKDSVDLVISGINQGQNMGEDVVYSGTVAAAVEAMWSDMKAIAISSASYNNPEYNTAAKCLIDLLKRDITSIINKSYVLNVNVPSVPFSEIKGTKITYCGHRKYTDFVTEQSDQKGRKIYWVGGKSIIVDDSPETDYWAVKNNFVSVTPLTPDYTNRKMISSLIDWQASADNK